MNIRGDRADDVTHGTLVQRFAIRMQQADREGLDALRQKMPDLLLNLRPVQRTLNRSVSENSLFDRPAPPTRNQRRWLFQIEIVKIETMLGSYFDCVTKTLGDEQGRSRTAPLITAFVTNVVPCTRAPRPSDRRRYCVPRTEVRR